MDELEKYGGKEIDLRKENQDNLKKYSVRLTGDEMDLLYELGCYLKDPKRNPSKSSNVYKATFEAVRKLPKVPRNMNYYYLQDPNFLVDEETEDKKLGKSSIDNPNDEKNPRIVLIEPGWVFDIKEYKNGGRRLFSDMSVVPEKREDERINPLFNWVVEKLEGTNDINDINECCEILIDSVKEENIPEVYNQLEEERAVKVLREKIGLWDAIKDEAEKKIFQMYMFSCLRDILLITDRNTRKKCFDTGFTETGAFKSLSEGNAEDGGDCDDENNKSIDSKLKDIFVDIVYGLLKEFIHDTDYDKLISHCGGISTFVKLAKEGKAYGVKALYIIYLYVKTEKDEQQEIKENVLSVLKDYSQDIRFVMPCLNILGHFSSDFEESDFSVKIIKGDETMEKICRDIKVRSEPIEEKFEPFKDEPFKEDMLYNNLKEFFGNEKAESIKNELGNIGIYRALKEKKKSSFLNLAEVMIIYIYMSGSGYYNQINRYIREHGKSSTDSKFIRNFFKTVRKLPLKQYRSLYRGQLGKYSNSGMVSTTREINITERFTKKAQNDPHIICFNNFWGYDLSFISASEEEVLTDPSMLSRSISGSVIVDDKIKVKDIEVDKSFSNLENFPPGPCDNFTYSVVRDLHNCFKNGYAEFSERKNVEQILDGAIREEEKALFRRFGGFDKVFDVLEKDYDGYDKSTEKDANVKKNALAILKAFIKDDGNDK